MKRTLDGGAAISPLMREQLPGVRFGQVQG